MTPIRKLPAGAGAEWLMGGFALLRRSPMGLGTLGLLFGVLGLLANLSLRGSADVAMVLQLVFIVLGPLLLAGMVYAAREVDAGRPATPGHLLRGLQGGKAPRILATLLPQVVAVVILVVLLYVLIGPAGLESMAQTLDKMQGQAQPDPALLKALPVRRMLLWFGLAVVVGVLAGFFTFTALPEMMFTDRRALPAMKASFLACIRNFPAILVFGVLTVIATIALQLLVLLFAALVGAIAGQFVMQVLVQLVTMAVLMPVITGAMYVAWKQMQGGDTLAPPSFHGIEA